MTYRFEWKCKENKNNLMYATFSNGLDAWMSALNKCGWENRISLRTTDERGYTINNWFDVCDKLPLLCGKGNYESDKAYFMKTYWK